MRTRRCSTRLRLCDEGARHAEARLGRSLFLPSARSRRHPHRPEARRRDHRHRAAARHDRGYRGDARARSTKHVRRRDRRAGRRSDQDREARTRLASRPSRPRISASFCSRSSSDVRVLLVKLADRLHNMRTLEHMVPEEKRGASPRRRSTSTRRSPAAWACRTCARSSRIWPSASCRPDVYALDRSRLADLARAEPRRDQRDRDGDSPSELAKRRIKAKVTGREKKPYSIWRKMERKRSASSSSPTSTASASSCPTIEDCYRALGVVHTTWPFVPGRFKDYISTPKQNDYRSIHTTIVGPGRQRVELQIRTAGMHEIAEYGIAAHALYKDSERPSRTRCSSAQDSGAYALAAPARSSLLARGRQPGGVPRAHQARAVPGPGVLLHAEGAADRAAARRDADRFRLCGPHRRRQHCVGAKINGRPCRS